MSFDGEFHRADDAVLLPRPARRVPLMIGSNGPRMLSIALPHVEAWNTFYDDYDNDPESFARLVEQLGIPDTVTRSACVLVQLDGPVERVPHAEPVRPDQLPAHLRALGEAGADEAILVASPINEASIRALSTALGSYRTGTA